MLFGMVERGMDAEVTGDKGKARANGPAASGHGEEAMWAIVLTKELWKKGIWCVPSPETSTECIFNVRVGTTLKRYPLSLWDAFTLWSRYKVLLCTSSWEAKTSRKTAMKRKTT